MELAKFLCLHRQIVIIVYEEIGKSHQSELCSISLIYTLKRIALLNLNNKRIKKTTSDGILIRTVIRNFCKLVKH